VAGLLGPKTGDDSNAALYIALLALGVALVAGSAAYMLRPRRKKTIFPSSS
jgi:hypothetical protein